MTLLCFTPFVIRSVALATGGANLLVGSLYGLFAAYIVQGSAIAAYNFVQQSKTARSPVEKNQVRLVLSGLLLYASFAVASNVLLPVIIENWQSSRFGPVFSLFVVGTTGYAIVKHRLFDLRLIIARSLAYLTSVIVLAIIYGVLVFGIASILFNLHFTWGVEIFIIVATGIASLSFGKMKAFFDRVTNQFFYRDAYDTQAFLDEFNKTLVTTYELDQLLKRSTAVIEQNIKPTHCLFIVNSGDGDSHLTLSSRDKIRLEENDLRDIRGEMNKLKDKVVVIDELDSGHEALKRHLHDKDIVMAVRLAPNASNARRDIGYLMLGPKRSGNVYSTQDLRVMEIIANELVIATQNALRFEQIENFNRTLQAKVDEATKKLRKANEKLKELDETKDDFISMASHQLRTPLTSVKGYISMIMEGDAGKVTHMQREMLGQAFFSSQRMVYLIADLLNVSRLKTGKFIIDATPVDLAEVVEQELGQLEETAASRSLTITYDKPKSLPLLMLDEVKTRQVIMNFVDNAIYYTPSGGNIDVRLLDTQTMVELQVTDDGIGVPKSEQPHLFTKFYRAGNARKARPDGTGLGLFMAKKVIVAQGGSLIFESKEGKGSTFGFTLSKNKLAVDAKKPAPTEVAAKATPKT